MVHSECPPWLDGIEGEKAKELIMSDAPLIRVVAGPGSGKTTCLKSRTRRLIEKDNVDPERIFVGTFTRAVTQELRQRLGDEITVSTLHAFARKLLQQDPSQRNFHFLLEFEQDSMLYDVNSDGSFDSIGNIGKLRDELRKIQSSRSQISEYQNAAFSGAIDSWLRRYRSTLIGDVVFNCVSGQESTDIHSKMFDHVVIDEYQDLTAVEHELVKYLWSEKGSLTILGDDDQSIYGFRFNHPNGLAEFDQNWSGNTVVDFTFPDNRRCGERILDTANLIRAQIGNNKSPMIPKSERPGSQAFVHWNTINDELSGLAEYIKRKDNESFLVLVPRRFIGYQLAALIGNESKTYFREQTLENTIAKEVFSAACLLAYPDDWLATRIWLSFHKTIGELKPGQKRNAEAIANLPNDVGGRDLLSKIVSGEIPVMGTGKHNIEFRAKKALELIDKNLTPQEAIRYLFNKEFARSESRKEERRWLEKDLTELREAALQLLDRQEVPNLKEVMDSLRYRIATRTPLVETDSDHRVKIMTLHAAKGLEADNVVIASAVDELMPGLDTEGDKFDEQRRLLYVAITRAKESLIVSWSRQMRFKYLKRYGGRIDKVITRAGEKHVTTKKSSLLPKSLNGVISGQEWLEWLQRDL